MEYSNLGGYTVQNWWYIMNIFIIISLAYLPHEYVRLHEQDGSEAISEEIH